MLPIRALPKAPIVRRAWSKLSLVGSASASLAAIVLFGLVAVYLPDQDLCMQGYLALMLFGGTMGVGWALQQVARQRALAFELTRGQSGSTYEVQVTLDPRSSARLTSVRAMLECIQYEAAEGYGDPETVNLFSVGQTLFEGSARLGHGEKFVRSAALPLPSKLRWRSGVGFSVGYHLRVHVDVDGELYLEHEEKVSVEIERDYETLSQT